MSEQIHVLVRLEPTEIESWEVGYFEHDPSGRKLVEPVLGVRCLSKRSTWMPLKVIQAAVERLEESRDS